MNHGVAAFEFTRQSLAAVERSGARGRSGFGLKHLLIPEALTARFEHAGKALDGSFLTSQGACEATAHAHVVPGKAAERTRDQPMDPLLALVDLSRSPPRALTAAHPSTHRAHRVNTNSSLFIPVSAAL